MMPKHREFRKNFETEVRVNDTSVPLNNFIQETIANMVVGLLKTLKAVDEHENIIEIKITRVDPRGVDAHTYP